VYILLTVSPVLLYAQRIPQDALYLQHNLLVNPAYTGSRGQWYAQMYYNKQWWHSGSPDYINASVDGGIGKKSNLGFYASSESMGLVRTTSAVFSYAYRIPLVWYNDITLGVSVGAAFNDVDIAALAPVVPDDPALLTVDNTLQPHVSIGVLYESNKYFVSAALRNLAGGSPLNGLTEIMLPDENPNATLSFGTYMPVTENIELQPSIMWQEDLKTSSTFDIRLALLYKYDYRIGISFRTEQPLWKSGTVGNDPTYSLAFGGEIYYKRFTFAYNYILGLNSFVMGAFNRQAISVGYYITNKVPHRFRIFHFKRHTEYCPTCY
jgi:type IX secretion system PorP/SprF family membrane protein